MALAPHVPLLPAELMRVAGPAGGFRVRPMQAVDLDGVMAIEQRIYPFPWTRGNFRDSLEAGYDMPVLEVGGGIVAYAVVMWLPDEVHLLNLSVDQPWQGQGLGAWWLSCLFEDVARRGATGMLLEVRPSNQAAIRLYRRLGFETVGLRKRYYPSFNQTREDAIVMFRKLLP